MLSDGGEHRHAARRPVVGPYRVARLMVNLARRIPPETDAQLVQVNGDPGIVLRTGARADIVLSFSFAPDGRVQHIYNQVNPDKLRHVT
jgi:RNA polymerase sigma-70 factor (ECF subfamily)